MKQTERVKNASVSRPSPKVADDRTSVIPLRESHALEDDDLVQRTQDLLDETAGHEHSSIRTAKRNPAMEGDEDEFDPEDKELSGQ